MPSTLCLAWSGELRGAGGAHVRRALCATGRIDWALYPEDSAKLGRILSGQWHDHTCLLEWSLWPQHGEPGIGGRATGRCECSRLRVRWRRPPCPFCGTAMHWPSGSHIFSASSPWFGLFSQDFPLQPQGPLNRWSVFYKEGVLLEK